MAYCDPITQYNYKYAEGKPRTLLWLLTDNKVDSYDS